MKGCEHDGTLLEDECWCVVKVLRAPNSYAVRRMLQALTAAEDYGVHNQSGYQPHVFVMSPTLAHQWRRWGLYVEQLEEMVEKLPRWSPSRYHANALLKRTMGNTLKHRLRRRWRKLKWRFQNDDELDG